MTTTGLPTLFALTTFVVLTTHVVRTSAGNFSYDCGLYNFLGFKPLSLKQIVMLRSVMII